MDAQPTSNGEGFSELSVKNDGEGGEVQEQAVLLASAGMHRCTCRGGGGGQEQAGVCRYA